MDNSIEFERKISYLNNDPGLPILQESLNEPIDTFMAVQLIVENSIDRNLIASTSPTFCDRNALFLIDASKLAHKKDILSDQHGHWVHSKTKRFTFSFINNCLSKEDEECLLPNDELLRVNRIIYYHRESKDFHRVLIEVSDYNFVCLQYYFTGEEHPVVATKAHGNSKTSAKPYIRTKKSVLQNLGNSKEKPKETFNQVVRNAGGVEKLKSPCDIPKNRHQISNIRYNQKTKSCEIEEIMDISKREKNTEHEFIREIGLLPSLNILLASNQQLQDIVRFCTNPSEFCILGVDATYNIGRYFVTLTTYRQLFFQTASKVNPVMIGPCIIHSDKLFNSYSFLPIGMIKLRPKIKDLLVFGTDSEKNLYEAMKSSFPTAYHLLCDIHMRDNIKSKMTELSLPADQKKTIVNDIFGRVIGGMKEEGLVDCLNSNEFDCTANGLLNKWRSFGHAGTLFANYFEKHKLVQIKNCMTAELRAMSGLGFPPRPYTQNANECINSVLKKNIATRQLTLCQIVQHIRSLVRDQEEQIKLSLIKNGEWDLIAEKCSSLQPQIERYFQMTLFQREKFLKTFNSMDMRKNQSKTDLSLTASESLILYPPFSILSDIFHKASKLMGPNVQLAPSGHRDVFIVSSNQNLPLIVTVKGNQISCQKGCVRYAAYGICEHAVAVAETCGNLGDYVKAFKENNVSRKRQLLDITNVDKSKNANKKATKFTSQRKGPANKKSSEALFYQSQLDQLIHIDDPISNFSPPNPADNCLIEEVNSETSTEIFNVNMPSEKLQSNKEKRKKNEKQKPSNENCMFLRQATENVQPNDNSYVKDIIVPFGTRLPPIPNMTEPQMGPYHLVKRSGKVSTCHGCGGSFDKNDDDLFVLKRSELDWWPRVDKTNMTKTWHESEKTHYYCSNIMCLIKRRPLLKKENITICHENTDIPETVKQRVELEFN